LANIAFLQFFWYSYKMEVVWSVTALLHISASPRNLSVHHGLAFLLFNANHRFPFTSARQSAYKRPSLVEGDAMPRTTASATFPPHGGTNIKTGDCHGKKD